MSAIFRALARGANARTLSLGTSLSAARRATLSRQARRWIAGNEPRLDRALASLRPRAERHPQVASALLALHRLRALAGGALRTRAESGDRPPDPSVAALLDLARRYVGGEPVPLGSMARQVRDIRARAGQLSIRDLDLSVGAATNVDSYRLRNRMSPVNWTDPLRQAVRARLRVP